MLDGKHGEPQGLPRGPGTLLTWGAQKASKASQPLSRDPEDGMEQSRETRGDGVPGRGIRMCKGWEGGKDEAEGVRWGAERGGISAMVGVCKSA